MIEQLLIDGHVHVHDCYDEATFLAAAHENLSRHGDGLPTLLLAEAGRANVFARWKSGGAAWPVSHTDELHSLMLGRKLLVIAGRQIVTAERVEVLALACHQMFPDGQPLDDTIKQVENAGALVLLPWGAGKWMGSRGRLISQAVTRHRVLLGDNSGRPSGWPTPPIFQNHLVLPGTDPLRARSQQRMVGSYGFALTGPFDPVHPAAGITAALRSMTQSPRVFGRRVGLLRFLRQQAELRIAK